MPVPPRRWTRFPLIFALGALLLLPAIPSFPFFSDGSLSRTRPGEVNVGDGLYTLTRVQQVSASAYWDNFFCPHPWPDPCTNAVGVDYIPSGNIMIVAEGQCDVNCNSTRNALVEFNATTGRYGPALGLNCYPYDPFFPAVGDNYFVPCYNYNQNWASIVSVDYRNATIVANITTPSFVDSMAYDSSSGLVYAGAGEGGGELDVVNPLSGTLVRTLDVEGATFVPSYWPFSSAYLLAYDATTDKLIAPSTAARLLIVDPTNATVTTSVPLPDSVESLAFDPASNQLLIATDNATTNVSGLTILNARTYGVEGRLVFPNCINYECVGSNSINQILPDALHGDAYLVGTLSLFTLNLSTRSLVGTIVDYGDGAPYGATYIPGLDQVISTYAIFQEGPGLLVQLHHGSVAVLSSLLWLPPAIGGLTIAQLIVGGIAGGWVWVQDRRRRRKEHTAPR